MSDQLPSDDKRIVLESMSPAGDRVDLSIDDHGLMYIGYELGSDYHGKYFDREQQLRLLDWVKKVLP